VIIRAEVGKLGAMRAARPGVLSLFLTVPLDPAELRGLPVRASELIAAAEDAAGGTGYVAEEDRGAVRQKLETGGRDWLGRTVAVFACADIGLFEVFPLPCRLPERAVLGARPHIRPLLVALQRCPAYRAAVVDRQHAWLFSVTGEEIRTVAAPVAAGVRDPDFGGWYGLEAYHVQRRVIELARRHYRDTAAWLERVMRRGEPEPLVIGGHHDGVRQLLASLPPSAREAFAGSFAADTHTLTPARVRELASPLVAGWAERRARRLAEEISATPPGGLVAVGLPACLASANAAAVETLVVPDDGIVPGFECGRCGALSADADGCPDGRAAAWPVPDLIEEMVTGTLADGGHVCVIGDGPARVAARLRFPVAQQ
jgi:Bacterial archaeo-eukaryotic release factor family 10